MFARIARRVVLFLLMDDITVLVLGDPAEPVLGDLSALGPGVQVRIGKTAGALAGDLPNARVLFHWTGTTAEIPQILQGAPKLEWIHSRYAGVDRILFPELIASPVPLTNGSGTFSPPLGEFAIFGALYFAKDMPRLLRAKAERRWDVFDNDELSTQTLGIVGHGDIGREVARRAKAMGMRVLALRRDPAPRAGDEHVDKVYGSPGLHDMLRECDYVVVAAPLTPDTKGLIGQPEFEAMKPEAVIMNIGRGPVIDEAAMIVALQRKRIRGAVLDVFDVEPLPALSPLWDMDNVVLSAHATDHTRDWLEKCVALFAAQFALWRGGQPLPNIVDKGSDY
jgi:phosphoglycerate dehydrogenase-like enzyme